MRSAKECSFRFKLSIVAARKPSKIFDFFHLTKWAVNAKVSQFTRQRQFKALQGLKGAALSLADTRLSSDKREEKKSRRKVQIEPILSIFAPNYPH